MHMGLEVCIWASKCAYGPRSLQMGLKVCIWVSCVHMGLETCIWASLCAYGPRSVHKGLVPISAKSGSTIVY